MIRYFLRKDLTPASALWYRVDDTDPNNRVKLIRFKELQHDRWHDSIEFRDWSCLDEARHGAFWRKHLIEVSGPGDGIDALADIGL